LRRGHGTLIPQPIFNSVYWHGSRPMFTLHYVILHNSNHTYCILTWILKYTYTYIRIYTCWQVYYILTWRQPIYVLYKIYNTQSRLARRWWRCIYIYICIV